MTFEDAEAWGAAALARLIPCQQQRTYALNAIRNAWKLPVLISAGAWAVDLMWRI